MKDKVRSKHQRNAFTLLEILIVVVIVGILASVAMARINGAEKIDADEAALRLNLRQMRLAIQRYALLHGGTFPASQTDGTFDAASEECFIRQLTLRTTDDGVVTNDRTVYAGPFLTGPMPRCSVGINRGLDTVVVVDQSGRLTADDRAGSAWKYNSRTGEFICNSTSDGLNGQPYSEW